MVVAEAPRLTARVKRAAQAAVVLATPRLSTSLEQGIPRPATLLKATLVELATTAPAPIALRVAVVVVVSPVRQQIRLGAQTKVAGMAATVASPTSLELLCDTARVEAVA